MGRSARERRGAEDFARARGWVTLPVAPVMGPVRGCAVIAAIPPWLGGATAPVPRDSLSRSARVDVRRARRPTGNTHVIAGGRRREAQRRVASGWLRCLRRWRGGLSPRPTGGEALVSRPRPSPGTPCLAPRGGEGWAPRAGSAPDCRGLRAMALAVIKLANGSARSDVCADYRSNARVTVPG